MTRSIKVGLIQMKCDEQVEVNFNKTIDSIKQAVTAGAQIVCTQELFKSPYFPQTVNTDFYTLGEDVHENSATVRVLSKLAHELDVVIIASLFEKRATGLYHNTAVVIDAGGQYLGKYRKCTFLMIPVIMKNSTLRLGTWGIRCFKPNMPNWVY